MHARGWRSDHQLWIEAFVLFNFAGLVADIFLAHSQNHFRRQSEYVPLVFSVLPAPRSQRSCYFVTPARGVA
jgi:hypothetical protein